MIVHNNVNFEDKLPPNGPVQINRGRWTKRERRIFEESFRKYGKEWKLIASLIQTRTVIQIRTHAQKYFQKLAKQTGTPVMSTSKKEKLQPLPPHLMPQIEASASDQISPSSTFAHRVPGVPVRSPASILGSHGSRKTSRKRKLADSAFLPATSLVATGQITPSRSYNLRKEKIRKKRGREYSLDQLAGSSSEQGSEFGEEPDMSQDDEISRELAFYNKTLATSKKGANNKQAESGRVTPRMLAAATLLLAPRFADKTNKIPERRLVWALNTLADVRY